MPLTPSTYRKILNGILSRGEQGEGGKEGGREEGRGKEGEEGGRRRKEEEREGKE